VGERNGEEAVSHTLFRYRAARADGAIVDGVIEAASTERASVAVTDRGLFPLTIALAEEGSDTARRPASRRDLAIVFQSVSALVTAGVPLERAVASSESLARGNLRDTLADARARL
jgi:type II secretory pathway component PulF